MFSYRKPIFGDSFRAPIMFAKRIGNNEAPDQSYRTEFMRDRDRVLYSSAFRRLAGKTQIYLAGENDHRRNRLTHTLEVAQISRTISHALCLDCDLTEAIALAHDLGHAPFGHAGEQLLHEIMVPGSDAAIKNSPMHNLDLSNSEYEDYCGFKHNIQSVRVVKDLETNYGSYGLDLTNYTLWGIQHHSSQKFRDGSVNTKFTTPAYARLYEPYYKLSGSNNVAWSFEAFVVREADEIAQWHHDLEDAIVSNALSVSDVCGIISENLSPIMTSNNKCRLSEISKNNRPDNQSITTLSQIVVSTLVNCIIECSMFNLEQLYKKYQVDFSNGSAFNFFVNHDYTDDPIISSIRLKKYNVDAAETDKLRKEYPSAIREKIHHSREVERMNAKGRYIIKKLFQAYYSNPQQLTDGIIRRYMVEVGMYDSIEAAQQKGIGTVRYDFSEFAGPIQERSKLEMKEQLRLMRAICDHIACMTDHYAITEYKNLYGSL